MKFSKFTESTASPLSEMYDDEMTEDDLIPHKWVVAFQTDWRLWVSPSIALQWPDWKWCPCRLRNLTVHFFCGPFVLSIGRVLFFTSTGRRKVQYL